jgi:glycosyltransferase involved in cell wall biosynthesis
LATITNLAGLVADAQSAAPHRWVVAFPGARDSYQVPLALEQVGLLNAFVTDWYSPMDRIAFRGALHLLPTSIAAKLRRRFRPGLPSNRAKLMPGYLARTLRLPDNWTTEVDRLGRSAAIMATKNSCGVLAYNHVATTAFTGAAKPRVLYQVQAHPISVRDAVLDDDTLPEFKDEPVFNELRWPAAVLDRYASEPLSADYCLVNCQHIKHTLIDHGVAENRIAVIPYGVDLEYFTPAYRPPTSRFNVLFVGQLVRQKGLHVLLEAWRGLSFPDSELRIIGRGARNERLLAAYRSNFTFVGALDWSSLREEYRRADLICSPSLTEGFGLVNLEALACGTPVLTSEGCGACDIIDENADGFIVPAGDLIALMAKLESAYRNRQQLRAMRTQARAKAEQYPWSRFRADVVRTLKSLEGRF